MQKSKSNNLQTFFIYYFPFAFQSGLQHLYSQAGNKRKHLQLFAMRSRISSFLYRFVVGEQQSKLSNLSRSEINQRGFRMNENRTFVMFSIHNSYIVIINDLTTSSSCAVFLIIPKRQHSLSWMVSLCLSQSRKTARSLENRINHGG